MSTRTSRWTGLSDDTGKWKEKSTCILVTSHFLNADTSPLPPALPREVSLYQLCPVQHMLQQFLQEVLLIRYLLEVGRHYKVGWKQLG